MTFTVNDKKYEAKEIDFGMVCDLEECGVSMGDFAKKPLKVARNYFALCAGEDLAYADKELGEHIINGGNFEEIANAIKKKAEESDFFQKLLKRAAETK